MMNEWFTQYVRMNPTVQQPLPLPIPQQIPIVPQVVDLIRLNKPPVDKIRNLRAQEFWATVYDDTERTEFWLKNMIRVFNELSYTPD